MLRQYLVGAIASICNIAIHALVMVLVIKAARIADELVTTYQTLRLTAVMIAAVTVLMIAHLTEVLVWSLIYAVWLVDRRDFRGVTDDTNGGRRRREIRLGAVAYARLHRRPFAGRKCKGHLSKRKAGSPGRPFKWRVAQYFETIGGAP
jgi:hypothetical protein